MLNVKRVYPVVESVEHRLNNVHPVRLFETAARVVFRSGLLKENEVKTALQAVNSKQAVDEVFSAAAERISKFQDVRLDPSTVALASKQVYQSAFPSGHNPVSPIATAEGLLSRLNLNASSGYPDYRKKKLMRSNIIKLFKNIKSGTDDVLLAEGSTPFTVFNRIQAKESGELSFRLFFAPS
jgi:hypothetical protein